MGFDWIFEPLGIEETKDKKLIRKAYAQKIKECHPEEHPEEWQRLHQAYKNALNYAAGYYWYYDDDFEDIENSFLGQLDFTQNDIHEKRRSLDNLGFGEGDSKWDYPEVFEKLAQTRKELEISGKENEANQVTTMQQGLLLKLPSKLQLEFYKAQKEGQGNRTEK